MRRQGNLKRKKETKKRKNRREEIGKMTNVKRNFKI
jgi:hypothetical protein